ncbi:MAG TPA: penicillin-binding protein 2, partial [Chloroflexota bacterium]|nr:penicillin-binding protein 2 [Chloroflexota bacterium]
GINRTFTTVPTPTAPGANLASVTPVEATATFALVGTPTVPVVATETPAEPTSTPDPAALGDTVRRYIESWQAGQYSDMYGLLSTAAKASITETRFVARYTNIADGIGQTSVAAIASPELAAAPSGNPATVNVPMHVTYKLSVLGDVEEDNLLPLVLENGAWKIAWTPALIFRDLSPTRTVRYDPVPGHRGSIFDRNGNVLAQDGIVLVVGIVPGEIKDEPTMLKTLSDFLKIPADSIKKAYAGTPPDWFVPIKDISSADSQAAHDKLDSVLGVSIREQNRRVYPYGSAAAHVVGYVSRIQDSDLKTLAAKGYDASDWIGRAGLEAWGEDTLAGQKGATLSIVEADGTAIRTIAQKLTVPGNDIYTTLDINYQIEANKVLGDKAGSLILMNPQDNSLLAVASQPTYDPNLFVLGMSDAQWAVVNGPGRPLIFRAAEGLYATGSIFKPITMSAGLERGGFKPSDTFDCGLDWKGLKGVTLHNWKAEGTLNLIQSLTGSCDPTFYTIGLKLSQLDPNILPSFARAYGLGQSIGAAGIADLPGTVPDPAWKEQNIGQPWYDGDGVNLAIGQGYLLSTPLQMANAFSVLANRGTVRTPVLISKIKRADGTVVKSYTAETRGVVPVSPTNLGYILEGMRQVTSTPLGTAYYAWQGSKIPMEAKTGSAENETAKAHAWFVGFTSPEHPTILTLVMLEGGELGGQFAAPLGRQIVEYAVANPVKPSVQ